MKRLMWPGMLLLLVACQHTAPENTRILRTVNVDLAKLPACEQSYPPHLNVRGPAYSDTVKHADTGERPLSGISDPLDLRPFTGVPRVRGGCLWGVAEDSTSFRNNRFILAGSGRIMQLRIGNENVYLKAVDKDPDNFFEWWYKGHGYQVHVKMQHRQDSEENTFLFDGYMEISTDRERIVVPVFGGGGC